MKRLFSVLAVAAIIVGFATPALAAKVTKKDLRSKLIHLSQLPSGWSVNNSSSSSSGNGGCFANTKHIETRGGDIDVSASFQNGNLPDFDEEIAGGHSLTKNYTKIVKYLNGCKKASIVSDGTKYNATVGAMSFPTVGTGSAAYQVNFSIKGLTLGLDIIVFKASSTIGGVLLYDDLGTPDLGQLHNFANLALKDMGFATTPAGSGVTTTTTQAVAAQNTQHQTTTTTKATKVTTASRTSSTTTPVTSPVAVTTPSHTTATPNPTTTPTTAVPPTTTTVVTIPGGIVPPPDYMKINYLLITPGCVPSADTCTWAIQLLVARFPANETEPVTVVWNGVQVASTTLTTDATGYIPLTTVAQITSTPTSDNGTGKVTFGSASLSQPGL